MDEGNTMFAKECCLPRHITEKQLPVLTRLPRLKTRIGNKDIRRGRKELGRHVCIYVVAASKNMTGKVGLFTKT